MSRILNAFDEEDVVEDIVQRVDDLILELNISPTYVEALPRDDVFIEIAAIHGTFNESQWMHYRGVRYHIFHTHPENRVIGWEGCGKYNGKKKYKCGRYNGKYNEFRETIPKVLIPNYAEYTQALEWLRHGERGSGRSYLLAVCFVEKGFTRRGQRTKFFDHHTDGGYTNSTGMKNMYNEIWNLTEKRAILHKQISHGMAGEIQTTPEPGGRR